ncbi:PPE family protein [Mycobacterium kansasii]|uniref:PPE family protein n=1 Tax=Mycobacterium kansasii TaxID=1768 RepID=A0A1V3XL03_MYCKA|nr:PPE family protein [Mycobacterium kansasii]
MDFGALPPEINSARMYTGPGSGSLLAAAQVWDGVAIDLYNAASAVQSVIWGLLVGPWRGTSAGLMVAAASPYVTWLGTTAAQAELTADQVRTAATAYEAAFATTVPPAVIAGNRIQLLTLIASNLFGQNTPAIAVTEADYGEMWAQDAAAMYGYAGSAAVAAETLTPFDESPEITNAGGLVQQAGAVEEATDTAAANQLISTVPQALQQLAEPGQGTTPFTAVGELWKAISPHLSPISNIVSMLNNHVSMLSSGMSMTNTASSLLKGMAPAAAQAVESAVESGPGPWGRWGAGWVPPGSVVPGSRRVWAGRCRSARCRCRTGGRRRIRRSSRRPGHCRWPVWRLLPKPDQRPCSVGCRWANWPTPAVATASVACCGSRRGPMSCLGRLPPGSG